MLTLFLLTGYAGAFKSLTRRQSHPLDKERAISVLDVHYRTLVMMGFQLEDIEHAFESTVASSMDDLLDWVSPGPRGGGEEVEHVLIPR